MVDEPRRTSRSSARSPRAWRLAGAALLAILGCLAAGDVRSASAAVALRSVTVSPSPVGMTAGEALQFAALANWSDGTSQDITQIAEWTTGSSRVAIVSSTAGSVGLVTAVGPGKVRINAALVVGASKTKGYADVEVLAPPLAAITTKPTTKNVEVGLATQFKATALYVNDLTADVTKQVSWSSSDPTVATVDDTGDTKGLVRPRKVGTTTITARDPATGMTNTDGATTVRAAVVSLSIEPADLKLGRQLEYPLRAYAKRADGTRSNVSSDVEWSSSAGAVASVASGEDEGGVVTALSAGSATISAFDPKRNLSTASFAGNAAVTVSGRLVGLRVEPAPLTLGVGEEKKARAIGTLSGGGETSDLARAVRWSVADPGIARVGGAGADVNEVTGLASGQTTLTAREPITGLTSTESGNVKVLGAIQSLVLEVGEGLVGIGETVELKARATYEGGLTSNLSDKCDWSVKRPRIATVDDELPDKGLVTGSKRGRTKVTAVCDGVAATATIRVIGHLVSLEVSPATYGDEALSEKKFHAIGHYDGGEERDLTKVVQWSSSAPSVVKIDDQEDPGAATLLQAGVATLTAHHPSGLEATSLVTVEPGIVGVEVVPDGKTIYGSTTMQMRAQGDRADRSIKVVTKDAHWTSSNEAIARVSNRDGEQGMVFGGGQAGTATITATLENGMSGSAHVTTSVLLTHFQLLPATKTVPLLSARIVEARGFFADGSSRKITRSVTYRSSDTSKVVVSNDPGSQGVVTGVGLGSATITATDPSSGLASDNGVVVTVTAP